MSPSNRIGDLSSHPIFLVLRILLAAIMLYAALPKFVNWETSWTTLDFAPFSRSIFNYRLVPVEWVNLIAMTIPPLELIGAFILLTGVWLRAGSLMLCLLQSVFIVGVAQAFYRGLDISCGCFAGLDTKVGWGPLIRDSLFFAGFLLVFLTTFKGVAIEAPSQDDPEESPPISEESSA